MTDTTMHYIEHGQGGDADVLHLAQMDIPTPKDDEVLIKVAYAGVNRPDILQRSGVYPPPKDAVHFIGLEVSGTIISVGKNVQRWQGGEKVCALTHGGGYAEYVAVKEGHCLEIPAGLDMLQAAAIPETYLTVWSNVFQRGNLQQGEIFLVHGGSSGIGLTAIQLAKHFGATVYTTVGNDEKMQACQKIGADHVINYRTHCFFDAIKNLPHNNSVDVILDMVGGDYIQKNLKLLALEGRLVQIAFLQGSKSELNIMPIMLKRLTVTGSTLRARTDDEKEKLCQSVEKHIFPLFKDNKCLPVIHAVLDLKDAAKAHTMMEASQHIGKIMLKVAP